MPLVSVIIPTYNYAKYIESAIDSVFLQDFKDYEIIVIDDGSTDNTKEALKKYSDRIIYVYQRNKGLSAARNAGIKRSKGEYLVFLDSDDVILPGKLQAQASMLDINKDIGWVYSDCFYTDDKKIIIKKTSETYPEIYKNPPEGRIFEQLILGNFLPVNSVMIRKSCVLEAGLFDKSLKAHEDLDLWLKVSVKYNIKYINRVLCSVMLHEGSIQQDLLRMLKSRIFVIERVCKKYPEEVRPCLSAVESGLKKYKKELLEYEKHLEETRKQESAVCRKLGYELYYKGDFKVAKKELLKAIKIYPNQKRIYLYYIMSLIRSIVG